VSAPRAEPTAHDRLLEAMQSVSAIMKYKLPAAREAPNQRAFAVRRLVAQMSTSGRGTPGDPAVEAVNRALAVAEAAERVNGCEERDAELERCADVLDDLRQQLPALAIAAADELRDVAARLRAEVET